MPMSVLSSRIFVYDLQASLDYGHQISYRFGGQCVMTLTSLTQVATKGKDLRARRE
jgi:hypothetical protein